MAGRVGDPWDPQLALASLTQPLHQEDDEKAQATKILQDSLVSAVQRVCHVAIYSPDEKLAFKAATYVIERNLGRVTDNRPLGDADPWEELSKMLNNDK
jgi:hypothetical protein